MDKNTHEKLHEPRLYRVIEPLENTLWRKTAKQQELTANFKIYKYKKTIIEKNTRSQKAVKAAWVNCQLNHNTAGHQHWISQHFVVS